MKPAGIIITHMSRQDWKGKSFWVKVRTIFFNLCLFVFQFVFMVVGTAIGKIKWVEPPYAIRVVASVGTIITMIGMVVFVIVGPRLLFFFCFLMCINFIVEFRGIPWAVVWRAAQASHVRLCLEKAPDMLLMPINRWEYINFGYPKAELQYWHMAFCDGKRFEYRDPTFTLPPEAIAEMIDYAHDQVGKPYDELQLLSPVLNFITWLFRPSLWGQEKIRWTNRLGGLEFCSSGVAACLQWAVKNIYTIWFFLGYDTAMVLPCMFVISEKWRKVK